MSFVNTAYNIVARQLSQKIEQSLRWRRFYKRFCFRFLAPKSVSHIPIFINNRNHLTYLRELINWLEENSFTNYYVIDNDSSYPPLLEYYKAELKGRVIFLGKNAGYLSIWTESLLQKAKNQFFVYTDSDVLPVLKKHPQLLQDLYIALRQYDFVLKAGCALKTDDLPANNRFRDDIIRHEEQHWQKKLRPTVYQAQVDTTFALYLPNYFWTRGYWDTHLRLSGNCLMHHQPWYEDTKYPTQEQQYYRQQATAQTHWTSLAAQPQH